MTTPTTASPHVIHPNGVYSVEDAQRALHLKPSTIRTEVRKRRLRVAKRAGRIYILGEWLLEWLRAGEVRREVRPAGEASGDAHTNGHGKPAVNGTARGGHRG